MNRHDLLYTSFRLLFAINIVKIEPINKIGNVCIVNNDTGEFTLLFYLIFSKGRHLVLSLILWFYSVLFKTKTYEKHVCLEFPSFHRFFN